MTASTITVGTMTRWGRPDEERSPTRGQCAALAHVLTLLVARPHQQVCAFALRLRKQPRATRLCVRVARTRALRGSTIVPHHQHSAFRRGLVFRQNESGFHKSGHVVLAPSQIAASVGAWLRYATEFREERMSTLWPEQPPERVCRFGIRLAIVLKHGNREHAVHEILSAATGSYLSRIRVPRGSTKNLV